MDKNYIIYFSTMGKSFKTLKQSQNYGLNTMIKIMI